ncbi:MAG: methyltransferase domain-containing protein [Candidatus Nanohaloarchaea archaeon]
MTYAYLLAGEDMELAEHELKGFLDSQQLETGIDRQGCFATAAEPMEGQLRRLALVHEVSEVLESGKLGEEPGYRSEGSFAVRAVEVTEAGHDTAALEEEFGSALETSNNEVDLEDPDENLRVYLLDDRYVLCRLVQDIDRGLFEKRKNQERPFSSPVSLDPVLARVLVNLSGVKPGEHLLDPFCGTGGILIEAGLCGVGVHGLDVQEEMVEGTRENLEEYGVLAHDVRQGKIAGAPEIFDREFDAVVTDLPYGEASKVEGEPVEDFLEIIKDICSGTAVFMSDQPELKGMEPEYEVYVHRNLTRYIYVRD